MIERENNGEGLKLLACPCCGAEARYGEIEDEDNDDFGGQFAVCTGCGLTTRLWFASMEDPKRVIAEAWNARLPDRYAEGVAAGLEMAAKHHDNRHTDAMAAVNQAKNTADEVRFRHAATVHAKSATAIRSLAPQAENVSSKEGGE